MIFFLKTTFSTAEAAETLNSLSFTQKKSVSGKYFIPYVLNGETLYTMCIAEETVFISTLNLFKLQKKLQKSLHKK